MKLLCFPGTDVMIFKIFSPKNFLLKLMLVFAKLVIITLVFEKNAKFFAENWQYLQKIVIITWTHGENKTGSVSMEFDP
jgi:hypothetical protein